MSPQGYIGNQHQWELLIEVDWLGQYAKTWAAFNAWYRNNFDLVKDRDIIEAIKKDEGGICSKIKGLIENQGAQSDLFRTKIANLHQALGSAPIKCNDIEVSFTRIEDYKHAEPIDESVNTVQYKIDIKTDEKKREIIIKKQSGELHFQKTISGDKYNKDFFKGLSVHQTNTLKGFLKKSSPIHNLVSPSNEIIDIGDFKFIDNKDLISRSIIEILYNLRNALFHGEITPDSETKKVYEPAYLILKEIMPRG